MAGNIENPNRWTIAEGELVKLNLRQCDCGTVWVPPTQASKVNGVDPGWYDGLAATRDAFEQDQAVDPVIRISSSKRGKIICPGCQD